MELVVPPNDFHFESTNSTPYVSAPSSPKRSNDLFDYYYHYTSAPASPTRIAAILAADDGGGGRYDNFDHDFAFEFSGQLEKGGTPPDLTAADELFEKGKIRPLKPPPQPYDGTSANLVERGRPAIASAKSKKGSRSLSPMRSGFQKSVKSTTAATAAIAGSECLKPTSGSRKWRLRDLLLFRSASEGRATGNKSKDPLRKFTAAPSSDSFSVKSKKESDPDSKNSSFRSSDGSGSSKRRSNVSAHEMHYMKNREVSEEMKKKTALPFNRQGIFGCLRFNPAVHSIAKGLQDGNSFRHR